MAGDIQIRERVVILPEAQALEAAELPIEPRPDRRVVHVYGSRVIVTEETSQAPAEAALAESLEASTEVLKSLSPEERLGYSAYRLRESDQYQAAKANRPLDGQSWDAAPETRGGCTYPIGQGDAAEAMAMAMAESPTSQRLTGSIAVGIIIVEGPNANLKFSEAERTKVVAEVQNGLSWLATQSPEGLVFKYDIKVVTLNVQRGPSTLTPDQKEARWRDPAMQQLGFGTGLSAVTAYVNKIRTNMGTTWTYCGLFTKYPIYHFAYASIGGPRLVMDYANDGWGPDNIDRVFAHETGHIFGAPDEYASSGCNCSGSWGFYGKPNSNCANCAPGGGVDCLMRANTWNMCAHTPYHLGFALVQQTYTGVWRQGNDAYYLWVNSSWNNFVAKWTQLAGQNLRLVDLKITRENGVERFHGVWRQGTGGYYLWVNASQADFVAKWTQLAAQGLRLVDLEVQNVNGTLLYSGAWLPGTDAYYLWLNADYNNFVTKWTQLAAQNLRLVDLKIVNVGGQQRFFGVWRQGTGGHYLWLNADWNNFVAKWQQLAGQGLRLVDVEITQSAQGQRFSGVWLAGTGGYYLWAGADWQHFLAKWQELGAQNLRLIDLDVVPASGAQSPTPDSRSVEFGGMAGAAASEGEEDGMGGGGKTGPDGEAGYGIGSVTGDLEESASPGGLAGEGGGSFGGPPKSNPDGATDADGAGFGGGTASTVEPRAEAALEMPGFGGGSLA